MKNARLSELRMAAGCGWCVLRLLGNPKQILGVIAFCVFCSFSGILFFSLLPKTKRSAHEIESMINLNVIPRQE